MKNGQRIEALNKENHWFQEACSQVREWQGSAEWGEMNRYGNPCMVGKDGCACSSLRMAVWQH